MSASGAAEGGVGLMGVEGDAEDSGWKGGEKGGGSRQAGIPDWVVHENAAWGLAVTEVNGDAGGIKTFCLRVLWQDQRKEGLLI